MLNMDYQMMNIHISIHMAILQSLITKLDIPMTNLHIQVLEYSHSDRENLDSWVNLR